jgi:hypothetical protein
LGAIWAQLRDKRRNFKRALQKAKINSWRKFTGSMASIAEGARISKILKRETVRKVGILKNKEGFFAHDREGSVKILLDTHFPGCKILSGLGGEQVLPLRGSGTWQPTGDAALIAGEIITEERVLWAWNKFFKGKSPGPDQILPIILHKCGHLIVKAVTILYKSSIKWAMVPDDWAGATVVFIPKPDKGEYEEPKSYRPISLTSFMLKGLERLMDRYIREVPLRRYPMHEGQHAYQQGRSCESFGIL